MSIMICEKHHRHYDSDFHEDCPECEEECEFCGGEGEVAVDEFDPDSGQYMRGVRTKKCVCQVNENQE